MNESDYNDYTEWSEPSNSDCGDWLYLNGTCYTVFTIQKPWNESRDDCASKEDDAELCYAQTNSDFDILVYLNQIYGDFWIGASRNETTNNFKWLNGTELSLTNAYWCSGKLNFSTSRFFSFW